MLKGKGKGLDDRECMATMPITEDVPYGAAVDVVSSVRDTETQVSVTDSMVAKVARRNRCLLHVVVQWLLAVVTIDDRLVALDGQNSNLSSKV